MVMNKKLSIDATRDIHQKSREIIEKRNLLFHERIVNKRLVVKPYFRAIKIISIKNKKSKLLQ